MNLLARREHSQKELSIKLQARDFEPADIAIVLQKLIQDKLLNEARFVESYITARSNKGFGPQRIFQELKEKGIEDELINLHLNSHDQEWFAKALLVWKKRFKNKMPQDFKTKAQHMRYLQYKGFSTEHIRKIIDLD